MRSFSVYLPFLCLMLVGVQVLAARPAYFDRNYRYVACPRLTGSPFDSVVDRLARISPKSAAAAPCAEAIEAYGKIKSYGPFCSYWYGVGMGSKIVAWNAQLSDGRSCQCEQRSQGITVRCD